MTESVSGFLSPEERAALEMRRRGERDEELDDIERLVIQTLAERGPTALPDLIGQVHARPRFVMTAVDQLEESGLVEVSVRGVQEFVELTDQGQSKTGTL